MIMQKSPFPVRWSFLLLFLAICCCVPGHNTVPGHYTLLQFLAICYFSSRPCYHGSSSYVTYVLGHNYVTKDPGHRLPMFLAICYLGLRSCLCYFSTWPYVSSVPGQLGYHSSWLYVTLVPGQMLPQFLAICYFSSWPYNTAVPGHMLLQFLGRYVTTVPGHMLLQFLAIFYFRSWPGMLPQFLAT